MADGTRTHSQLNSFFIDSSDGSTGCLRGVPNSDHAAGTQKAGSEYINRPHHSTSYGNEGSIPQTVILHCRVGFVPQPSTGQCESSTAERDGTLIFPELLGPHRVPSSSLRRADTPCNRCCTVRQDPTGFDRRCSGKRKTPTSAAPVSTEHSTSRRAGVTENQGCDEAFPGTGVNEGKGCMCMSSLREVLQYFDSLSPNHSAGGAVPLGAWKADGERLPQPLRRPVCGVFGLFSVMERNRFGAFAALFDRYRPLLEPFVERIVNQCPPLFPDVVNIAEFLRNPSDAPGEYFFDYSLVAWPLSVLYATSCFYVTAKQHGYHNLFNTLRQRGGLLTSGKDVLAALAVAMSPTEEELLRNTSIMYRAAFFVGSAYIDDERCLEAHVRKCSNCSFALLLVNIPVPSLKLLVDKINEVQFPGSRDQCGCLKGLTAPIIPLSKVEITRVLSTRCAVVCGNPVDLGRLDILVLRYAWSTGIKVHKEFLPIFTPENSSFYNQGRHFQLLQLWDDHDVELDPSSMHLTVYSPVDGAQWSSSTTRPLMDEVAKALTCLPHDLTYSLETLCDGDVLLDFSASDPGVGRLVEWKQRNLIVLSEPADVLAVSILPTPRRGRAKHVVESTLAKCAIVNNILQNMFWEGKPRFAYTETVSCNFADFGLLVRDPGSKRCCTESDRCPREVLYHAAGERDRHRIPSMTYAWESGSSPQGRVCCPLEYVVVPHERVPGAVGVHQVSSVMRYYEATSGYLLAGVGVEFTRKLSLCTTLPFPPHTLLMCPTVLDLIHLWETYEFLMTNALSKHT